jgi:hypothetical protein
MPRLSKNLNCPKCFRKVAKISDFGKDGKFVEVKHKGMSILARDAVITCIGCKTSFLVTTDNGIEKEVKLERRT